ncbi:MAG: restriction endonuclease subunit S [Paludibacteraceae bacterium]|nr:restriction endonuclease subunit S [Paludibacteraceae bacterium]
MNKIEKLIQELCPNGVEWKKLTDVCTLKARIGWQGLTKADYRTFGNYKLITGTDITRYNRIDFDSCVYVDEDRYNQDTNIQIVQGDLLITKDGTLGKIAYIEDLPMSSTLNGGLFVVRDKTGLLNQKFLMHYMLSGYFQEFMIHNHTNGTIKHLTQALLSKFEIPLPPLPVQTEIVRILDKFVEQQEQLEKLIELRKKQYEYYREEMLTAKEGWETKTLGEICDIKGRIGFRGYTREDQVKKGEGAISLSPGNIENSKLFFDDCAYISWDKYEESPEIMVNLNDVIFCKTGSTVGKVAIVTELVEKTTINPQLVVLKNVQCSNKYLYYYLTRGEIQYDVKKFAGIGSVPNISQEKLSGLTIKLPNEDIQNEIVKTLDSFESSISALTSALELSKKRYEHYRDEMLRF